MITRCLRFFVLLIFLPVAVAETIYVKTIDPSHITVPDPTPTPIPFPTMETWPKTVHILKATPMTGASGGVTMTKAPGTEVNAAISNDRKSVTISLKDPDLSASVPIDETDFLQQARVSEEKLFAELDNIRAEKRLAEIKEKEAEKSAGSQPYWSETSLPSVVMRNIKHVLKDPDSLKIRQVYAPRLSDYNGQKCWKINARIVSRNGFGGMVGEALTAWIQNGNLIDLVVVPEN